MEFGKYGNMGRSILNRDSSIRFVTIFDTRNENIVFSEHQPGVPICYQGKKVRSPFS